MDAKTEAVNTQSLYRPDSSLEEFQRCVDVALEDVV